MSLDKDVKEVKSLKAFAKEAYGFSLSSRFQLRLMSQAREGFFGSLRTAHSELRASFEKIVMLLPYKNIPLFLFGERGTGKRRLVQEFFALQSFINRLDEEVGGALFVMRSDSLYRGFTKDWIKKFHSTDFVYLEDLEKATLEIQSELLKALQSGKISFRLVLGTTQALSLKVHSGDFSQALFKEISEVSVYMPNLIDRTADLHHIVLEIIESLTAKKDQPSVQILDLLGKVDFPKNIDDLETLLRCLFSKKRDPRSWELEDFPAFFRCYLPMHVNKAHGKSHKEKALVQRALLESAGDLMAASMLLGISRIQLLQKMISLGIRAN